MKIVSIQEINQRIAEINTEISQIKADQKAVKRYAYDSSAAYDLLIEMREQIEKLEKRIVKIEAYRAKHHG